MMRAGRRLGLLSLVTGGLLLIGFTVPSVAEEISAPPAVTAEADGAGAAEEGDSTAENAPAAPERAPASPEQSPAAPEQASEESGGTPEGENGAPTTQPQPQAAALLDDPECDPAVEQACTPEGTCIGIDLLPGDPQRCTPPVDPPDEEEPPVCDPEDGLPCPPDEEEPPVCDPEDGLPCPPDEEEPPACDPEDGLPCPPGEEDPDGPDGPDGPDTPESPEDPGTPIPDGPSGPDGSGGPGVPEAGGDTGSDGSDAEGDVTGAAGGACADSAVCANTQIVPTSSSTATTTSSSTGSTLPDTGAPQHTAAWLLGGFGLLAAGGWMLRPRRARVRA